jgi:integrase
VPDTSRFRGIVSAYRASDDYKKLASATKRKWGPALDQVAQYFGDLRVAQFDRPEKIRPVIRRWRSRWQATPRTADLHLSVLSRVCSYAVDPLGKIAGNPCEGIKRLYSADRADTIWTPADIEQVKKTCTPEVSWAIDLAAHSGMRTTDLLRLCWSHVGDDSIVLRTSKSRFKREIIVPLHDGLRAVLAGIPKRSPQVLTNSLRRPWTVGSFESAIWRAKGKAGLGGRDLHFHDLRGTAATQFYVKGLPIRVIAEILGWTEENVEKIIRKYVGRQAATRAVIEHMRTNAAKPAAKPRIGNRDN